MLGDDPFLKVKHYLEGFPEPQILFFDLKRGSHREAIAWSGRGSRTESQTPHEEVL
jgi:hypothetical protein